MFEYEPKTDTTEARLTMTLHSGTAMTSRTTRGAAAEEIWEKAQRLSEEVPGPRLGMGLGGR